MSRSWTAREIAARLRPGEARFVLASSARRGKSYATLKRHARGASGAGLRRLFGFVTEGARREPRYVLNELGARVKHFLGGRV